MRCPLCEQEGPRDVVHRHLADSHAGAVEMWTEATSGRMRYRVQCPECGDAHEARVKPRSHDPQFLETFAYEIRLVAFDMLLNHLEAEHQAQPVGSPATLQSPLPPAGPGGGRGRPGADGVPLPPGMDEPDLPPWARAAEQLKITHHSGSER